MTELLWWAIRAVLGSSISIEYLGRDLKHGPDPDVNSGCLRGGHRVLFGLMIFLIKVLVNIRLNGEIQGAYRDTII